MLTRWTSGDALPEMVVREMLRRPYYGIEDQNFEGFGFLPEDFGVRRIGEAETVIAGHNATLITYEWLDDEGNEVRLVISSWFELGGVPTFLGISGYSENWDQSIVDAFNESIR
jgi:hypothetical protein